MLRLYVESLISFRKNLLPQLLVPDSTPSRVSIRAKSVLLGYVGRCDALAGPFGHWLEGKVLLKGQLIYN
jgi:hypothetical protein